MQFLSREMQTRNFAQVNGGAHNPEEIRDMVADQNNVANWQDHLEELKNFGEKPNPLVEQLQGGSR